MSSSSFAPPAASSAERILHIGNLDLKVDEGLLQHIFSTIGPVVQTKIIREKGGLRPMGYGFVEYYDHETAVSAMQTLNGRRILDSEIKISWAHQSSKEDTSTHHHLFVGDLSSDVTEQMLKDAFTPIGHVSEARIVYDQNTGRPRGYGFIAFREREEADRALAQMNGYFLGTKCIRVNHASSPGGKPASASSSSSSYSHSGSASSHDSQAAVPQMDYATVLAQTPPDNTTVYVANVADDATEIVLRTLFQTYGPVVDVRINHEKSYAFVRYHSHESAGAAICAMTGYNLYGRTLRCSWGTQRSAPAPMHHYPPPYGAAPAGYGAGYGAPAYPQQPFGYGYPQSYPAPPRQ